MCLIESDEWNCGGMGDVRAEERLIAVTDSGSGDVRLEAAALYSSLCVLERHLASSHLAFKDIDVTCLVASAGE